jgi:hypothetical protein
LECGLLHPSLKLNTIFFYGPSITYLGWSFCKKKKWIKIGWKIKSNKFEMRGTFQIFLGQFYVRNGNNAFFCKGLRNSWKKSQKVSKCGDRIRIRMLHSYIIFYTYIGVLENLIEIIV